MVTAFVLSGGGSLGAVQVGMRAHEPACLYPVRAISARRVGRAAIG